MENNYIERGAIGTFVDTLIEKKYPGQPVENYKDFREKSIDSINEAINDAIFNSLNGEQLDELNAILGEEKNDPSIFARFFERAGVDIEQKTKDVLESFQTDFLEAKNVE